MDKITIERETLQAALDDLIPLQAALDDLIRLAGLSADKAPWRRISALRAALAAQPAPAAVPPGYVLVPIEPTPEMVAAYLSANTEYWRLVDGFPPKIGVWRNGTPSQATAESYRAMIAAAKRVAP